MFEFLKAAVCLLGGSICLLITFCIVAGIVKYIAQNKKANRQNKSTLSTVKSRQGAAERL